MKRANKDAISDSIFYIESKLHEKLVIDELADQIYFSKTHYQRLFQTVVGEPVMEYIKKRRLQQACQALLQTKTTVLEIALQYGYASHEGFTRAFKALYGMPPTQFRKKHAPGFDQKSICREVLDMLSNEVTRGIAQHTQTIAESLTQFKVDLETLCASTEKTVIEVGSNGKGVMVLLGELKHFTTKTGCLIDEVKAITVEGRTVFELSDTIYTLLKNVDDLAFQIHLLRFLSGIEVARTGIGTFIAYQNELTGLSNGLQNHYNTITVILKGLMSLLIADIRKESVRSIRSAAKLVNETICMGKELTAEARTMALGMPYGAGFMKIAAEVEKRTTEVIEVAAILDRYADNLADGEPSVTDRASVDSAINSLKDIGFTMNLMGFNATVEAVRAGEHNAPADCADKSKNYAFQLHQTYTSCSEFFSESIKLSSLLVKSGEEHPDSIPQGFQKAMDDIIFQGGILTMQLGMESERSGRDVFKQHAKNADDAVALLSNTRRGEINQDRDTLSEYVQTISVLTKNCHADAEANMPHGMPFAFIAREFEIFVEKMNAVLDKTKQ